MKFHKYGIEFFDNKLAKYGGHSHGFGKYFNRLDYLSIDFVPFRIEFQKEYYDGYHNCLYLGFVAISWGN